MKFCKCPECGSKNITFDVNDAVWDEIYHRFIAYEHTGGECSCLDCGGTRLVAVFYDEYD